MTNSCQMESIFKKNKTWHHSDIPISVCKFSVMTDFQAELLLCNPNKIEFRFNALLPCFCQICHLMSSFNSCYCLLHCASVNHLQWTWQLQMAFVLSKLSVTILTLLVSLPICINCPMPTFNTAVSNDPLGILQLVDDSFFTPHFLPIAALFTLISAFHHLDIPLLSGPLYYSLFLHPLDQRLLSDLPTELSLHYLTCSNAPNTPKSSSSGLHHLCGLLYTILYHFPHFALSVSLL